MSEKRKTHTSTAVKRRYNEKAYDRINLTVKKGMRETYAALAAERGLSLNGFINQLLEKELSKD